MFNNTKYTTWYLNIIKNAKSQPRKKDKNHELHHIHPKSLGGLNTKDNLVFLTYREHFLCHWLLIKMFDEVVHQRQMHNAFHSMLRYSQYNNRTVPSWAFSRRKLHARLAKLGTKASIQTKEKISNSIKKSWENADDRKKKLSERSHKQNIGKPKSKSTKEKISKSLTGVKHSPERNLKKSTRQKKIWKLIFKNMQEITVSDLQEFCKQNGYLASSISNLKSGRIKSHHDIIFAEIV